MNGVTRVFTNVGIVAMVALLFAGCALLPGKKTDPDPMFRSGVTSNDPTFTELSDDDSIETIESELDATLIEDEDFSELEAELNAE